MIYVKSRLFSSKQEQLIEHFVSGSTACCTADLVGANKSTAAYYFHRLLRIIACQIKQEFHEVYGGKVEIDERLLLTRGGKLVYTNA